MTDVVIVGAGECGVRAAFALRERGFEQPITLIGEERHLPYERPPLSKAYPVAHKPIASEQAYDDAKIDFQRGVRVESVDRRAKTVTVSDGSSVPYGTLVLATGARARLFPGMELALTLRTHDDAEAILGTLAPGKRLAIIGGGFIGLELAATTRGIGAAVTVIEAADRLMARAVPAEIARVMEDRHRAEGVVFHLGAAVAGVKDGHVRLGDGRTIEADVIVAGVGAVPNTALAEAANLDVANGIAVDASFRTSDPSILAAGDCCSFSYRGKKVRLESWRSAQDQANHLADAIIGNTEPYGRHPWFWSDQYDLGLQIAGMPDPAKPSVKRDLGNGAFILFQIADDSTLLSAAGVGPGNAVAKDIRLAEMLMDKGAVVDAAQLADPDTNLKKLLKS